MPQCTWWNHKHHLGWPWAQLERGADVLGGILRLHVSQTQCLTTTSLKSIKNSLKMKNIWNDCIDDCSNYCNSDLTQKQQFCQRVAGMLLFIEQLKSETRKGGRTCTKSHRFESDLCCCCGYDLSTWGRHQLSYEDALFYTSHFKLVVTNTSNRSPICRQSFSLVFFMAAVLTLFDYKMFEFFTFLIVSTARWLNIAALSL